MNKRWRLCWSAIDIRSVNSQSLDGESYNVKSPKLNTASETVYQTCRVFLFVLAMLVATMSYAQQCFFDAVQAYDYVITQQEMMDNTYDVINLNQASEAELTQLQGIGSSKAKQIILYREAFGSFATVDELAKVKGIGQKIVNKNRAKLTVN